MGPNSQTSSKPTKPGEKKEEVYGFKTYFRELGYYLCKLERYSKSLKPFDEAISKTPDDVRARMGRSIARAKEIEYVGALDDVKELLALKNDDWTAMGHKALCTYLCCEFEDALVQNLRMNVFRKKPETFSLGAMQCKDAIENCIGDRAGRPLRDHFKVIRKMAWEKSLADETKYTSKRKKYVKKTEVKWDKFQTVRPRKVKCENATQELMREMSGESIINELYQNVQHKKYKIPPMPPFPYEPLQKRTSNIHNLLAQTYLDRMYLDKNFLIGLPKMIGVKSPNYEGFKRIQELSKEAVRMLTLKQDLLRARRPYYFIKFQQSLLPTNLQKKMEKERLERVKASTFKADQILKQLEENIYEEQVVKASKTAWKLWSFCKSTQKKFLPEREDYLKKMYALLAKALIDLRRINPLLYEWDCQKRIYYMLGGNVTRVASNDSVLRQLTEEHIDYQKQIKVLEEMLRNASCCEEVTWLYHELARSHLELKHIDLGKSYAKNCFREASRVGNLEWQVNALILLTRVHVNHHRKYDAQNEIKSAIEIAQKLNNYTLIEYLKVTLNIVTKMNFDELNVLGGLEKRQQEIIGMMAGSTLKEEVSHLFRKMSALPPSRRMSVLPGVKVEDMPSSPGARKQSIAPKPKDDDDDDDYLHKKKNDREDVKQMLQFHIE